MSNADEQILEQLKQGDTDALAQFIENRRMQLLARQFGCPVGLDLEDAIARRALWPVALIGARLHAEYVDGHAARAGHGQAHVAVFVAVQHGLLDRMPVRRTNGEGQTTSTHSPAPDERGRAL